MSLFKKIIAGILGSPTQEIKDRNGILFYIRCGRCGTPVRIRADKYHDFHRDHETGELIMHKEIMDGGCFNLMHATIRVNGAYRIIHQEVEGGEFITWEEYNQQAPTSKSNTS